MVKFLIASHGKFASGIKTSLEVLLGSANNVDVFDAYVDERNIVEEIEKKIKFLPEETVLIMFSDILGGSVNQIMMRYLNRKNTYLISGVNLALVIEIVSTCTDDISIEKLQEIVNVSRDAMKVISLEENNDNNDNSEDFF